MNYTFALKASVVSLAIIALVAVGIYLSLLKSLTAIDVRKAVLEHQIEAYKEGLVLTAKACKLDVAALRQEIRELQRQLNEATKEQK